MQARRQEQVTVAVSVTLLMLMRLFSDVLHLQGLDYRKN